MSCCKEELDQLSEELEFLTLKLKNLKKEYQSLLVTNLEKDLLINKLIQKNESKKYTAFESVLSTAAIERMRSLSNSQRDDCQFIYIILNDIYGDSLWMKTLSGRSNTPFNASEIPTNIRNQLCQLFDERLKSISTEETTTRKDSINRCIRNAIDKAKRGERMNSTA